ncbi:hypothetical protein KW798_02485 [Candidatus Parcubacteria bacterium]|nr:hypothetical protein [Candidatus Parcubacteria bacterium]
MIVQTWVAVLQQSFYNLLWGVVNFIPNFVLAVIIFLIGWFIASWLDYVIEQAIKAIHVDNALRGLGVEGVVNRAGYGLNAGKFLGLLVKWFVIVVFLIAALSVMGLTQVTFFLQQVVLGYVPNVIVAALILLVAAVVADVAQKVISGAARAAGVAAAGFAGAVARWAIWVFALLAALSQLGIATALLQTLFTGVVVALSLAFGLAFGLGGQESASHFLQRVREEMRPRN